MIQALVKAIEESTTMSNPSPYSRPGFTEECKEAQQRARQLKKRWKKNPTPETWEEFRTVRNYKGTIIKKAMRAAYRKAVTEACTNEKAMWKFFKWSRNRAGQQQAAIPEIEGETDPEQKALRFKEAFSTEPPASTGEDLTDYAYKDRYETPGEISTHEIRGAIYELSSGRAPGLDNIPSEILKATTDIIISHVHLVFNVCFKIGYCPYHFKESVTVVLRKHNKDDYTKAKSYHPVALLNTLGKVLEAILAERLSYLATEHTLLPRAHMGGRKGTSTDHACHYLLEQVYAAWNTKKVASLLLLVLKGQRRNGDKRHVVVTR